MDLCFLENNIKGIKVIRNSDFLSTGFLNMNDISKILTFIKDESYLDKVEKNNNISAIIATHFIASKIKRQDIGIIESENPEKMFYIVHNFLANQTDFFKQNSFETKIGKNCNISSNAVVSKKNVIIGANTIIEPGAVIMEGTIIGSDCFIGANSVIGTKGFQFYREENDAFYIEHIGGVIIENNVTILSNSCVATGLIYPTIIHDNTKIDNLVHIGHSAEIGKRVLITAGAIIGGSSKIEDRAWIGINSVMKAESFVGEDAFICMGAVVTTNVNAGQKVSGNFAIEHSKQVEFIKELTKGRGNKNDI